MTKTEFIAALATKQGIPKTEATILLANFKEVLTTALSTGEPVILGADFGTFKPVTRTGTMPVTNKPYSSKSVKFTLVAQFKRSLN